MKGTHQFPIQKWAIFRKSRESAALRGSILLYTAQAIPPNDAEIAGKAHFWKETNSPHGIGRRPGSDGSLYGLYRANGDVSGKGAGACFPGESGNGGT